MPPLSTGNKGGAALTGPSRTRKTPAVSLASVCPLPCSAATGPSPSPVPSSSRRAGGTWEGRARSSLPGQGWGLWKDRISGAPTVFWRGTRGTRAPRSRHFPQSTQCRAPKHGSENTGQALAIHHSRRGAGWGGPCLRMLLQLLAAERAQTSADAN